MNGNFQSRRLASTLLERLCSRCVDELGVDAAAVSSRLGAGTLSLACASTSWVSDLEEQAAVLGEGPQLDVMAGTDVVSLGNLAGASAASRWPEWAPLAASAGAASVSCLAIREGAATAGTLTLYSTLEQQLSGRDLSAAFGLADAALFALLERTMLAPDEDGDVFIDHDPSVPRLLQSVIHQASGMVMVQAGVSIDDALVLLRARAFRSGRSTAEIADDVVARRVRFADDGLGNNENGW